MIKHCGNCAYLRSICPVSLSSCVDHGYSAWRPCGSPIEPRPPVKVVDSEAVRAAKKAEAKNKLERRKR